MAEEVRGDLRHRAGQADTWRVSCPAITMTDDMDGQKNKH